MFAIKIALIVLLITPFVLNSLAQSCTGTTCQTCTVGSCVWCGSTNVISFN